MGLSTYWLATPLKTTKSGAGAPAAALARSVMSPWGPRYHSLWTTANSWSTGSKPPLGSTMTMPYMPLAMWWSVGDVPQWYIQTPAYSAVHFVELLLARLDRGHLVVPGHLAGVEVDGVVELTGRGVDEPDADLVALVDTDDGAGHAAVERPDLLDEALGDRASPSPRWST